MNLSRKMESNLFIRRSFCRIVEVPSPSGSNFIENPKSSQAKIQNYSYSLKIRVRQMLGCLTSNYAPVQATTLEKVSESYCFKTCFQRSLNFVGVFNVS
jgi:hypothetical protein